MKHIPYLLFILFGYLSGSMLYAYFLPKWLCKMDITALSRDRNPGTANAFSFAGIPIGIAVVLLELFKGFLPVFLAMRWLGDHDLLFALVMAAPAIGHAFPFWRKGGGGKAIAVSFGVMLGLWEQYRPLLLLVGFYLLFSLVIKIDPHLHRTVVTFLCVSVGCLLVVRSIPVVLGTALVSGVVIFKHFAAYQGEKLQVHWFFEHPPKPQNEKPNF